MHDGLSADEEGRALGQFRWGQFTSAGALERSGVPKDLPDGYLEVHTFTVDSTGILYGGDNQYGRTQKFVPKPGADPKQLIRAPWKAKQ